MPFISDPNVLIDVVGTADATEVERRMRALPEMNALQGQSAYVMGVSGAVIDLAKLAEWLVWRAGAVGAEEAVGYLDRILHAGRIDFTDVAAVYGISVPGEVRLSPTERLVPFSDLPDSPQKDALTRPEREFGFEWTHDAGPPQVALERVVRKELIVAPEARPSREQIKQDSADREQRVEDIARLTTLLGHPCSPAVVMQWYEGREGDPWRATRGTGWRGPGIEVKPHTLYRLPEERSAEPGVLLQQFDALQDRDTATMRVALDRFNLAVRRLRLLDRAMDLGIAFEVLLTRDKDRDDPIAQTLRLRGAAIHGDDFDARFATFETLRTVYTARCKAAHAGAVDEAKYGEAVGEGFDLFRCLARKLLRSGLPSAAQWNRLVVGDPKLRARYVDPG